MTAEVLSAALISLADPVKAAGNARYLAIYPGGYGEGDQLLGVSVPQVRALARGHRHQADLDDVAQLLVNPWHEVRLLGAVLLNERYRLGGPDEREAAVALLLAKLDQLNNWDLIDTAAPHTLGAYLVDHPERQDVLFELADSPLWWRRRMAVVATQALIRVGRYRPTLELSARLIDDPQDLIHKAIGWMLREVGQRDRAVLNEFLDTYAARLPRVALRYAIEKHDGAQRAHYLGQRRESQV